MSSASRHFKLGVLALTALAALVIAGLAIGLRGLGAATVDYHTYFDESVQGLDLGAPVKYRGVRIGNVASIAVAPDKKHVAVGLALIAGEAERLGLADANPALRTQLSTQGLTGVKFVEIDFSDPASNPPPQLPFPPDANYIPARASMMKGLADNLEVVGQKLPGLIDHAVSTLAKIELVLDDFHGQRVAHQVADVVTGIGGATADARRLLQHLDHAQIGDKAASMLGKFDATFARLNSVLDRIDGDSGLVASAQRAAVSIGDVGAGATGGAAELEVTLRDLGQAARAIRELVEEIDRDPDMLVKGRARTDRP